MPPTGRTFRDFRIDIPLMGAIPFERELTWAVAAFERNANELNRFIELKKQIENSLLAGAYDIFAHHEALGEKIHLRPSPRAVAALTHSARPFPRRSARTPCIPSREIWPSWKRSPVVCIRNYPHGTDAPLESRMGERTQGRKGLLPLPRSPAACRLPEAGTQGCGGCVSNRSMPVPVASLCTFHRPRVSQ